MHRLILLLLCLTLTGVAAPLAAEDYSLVPEAFIYCTTCHGVEFRGNRSVDAPRLNGMADWYVRSQMLSFKAGHRGTHPEDLIGMEMQPQAAALTEQAIDDVVAYIASVPVRTVTIEHTVDGNSRRGKSLYASCGACHGSEGQGSEVLNAPALAGQSDWYMVRQLAKYRAGSRGYHADDTSGAQMRAATAVLTSDQDINDVVAYINTLITP